MARVSLQRQTTLIDRRRTRGSIRPITHSNRPTFWTRFSITAGFFGFSVSSARPNEKSEIQIVQTCTPYINVRQYNEEYFLHEVEECKVISTVSAVIAGFSRSLRA